jgi:hypothetical protein
MFGEKGIKPLQWFNSISCSGIEQAFNVARRRIFLFCASCPQWDLHFTSML